MAGYSVPPAPKDWEKRDGGWLCNHCVKDEFILAQLADEGLQRGDFGAPRVERRARVEYELARDADAPDGVVGKRAGASAGYVHDARKRLGLPPAKAKSQPQPQTPLPGSREDLRERRKAAAATRHAALYARVDEALKATPKATDKSVGVACQCSAFVVRKRRKLLEDSGVIPATIRKGFASKPYDRRGKAS
jgi:hypothetical protein